MRVLDLQHVPTKAEGEGALNCPEVSRRRLHDLVDIVVGQVVTERQMRETKRSLKKFFQSIGYERPTIEADTVGDPLTLRVRVKTNRCWLLRVWEREAMSLSAARKEPAFRFPDPIGRAGSKAEPAPFMRGEFETWRPLLPFAESGVFERVEALRGVGAIRAVLENQGFLFAEVRLEHQRLQGRGSQRAADDPMSPVMGTIDYYVTHNYERRLQGLRFEGLESFGEEEVIAIMDTKVHDFLGDVGHLELQKMFFDLTKVKRYYEERGFFAFKFGLVGEEGQLSPRRSRREDGEWLIWEYRFRDRGFRVRKRKTEMVLYLDVPIIEGPRTKVISTTFVGHDALSEGAAKKLFALDEGSSHGKVFLEKGLEKLKAWYSERGYHRASISPKCQAYEPDASMEECDPLRVRSNTVALELQVTEGPRSSVGEIFWRGNFKSHPDLLLRDLPQTGDPYRAAAIVEAARKIRNLGVFNSVKIEPIGIDETPPREKIALVVAVEEGRSRFMDFAFGFRTIDRDFD
ncbi:MAG: POTRA domain-containing protein, partial [Myxococcota bacterium]|nr:POTRA domain-containing protein [Myxococcota bacterium]